MKITYVSEITELKYTSLLKMIILEENFKRHLEAFASELFIYRYIYVRTCMRFQFSKDIHKTLKYASTSTSHLNKTKFCISNNQLVISTRLNFVYLIKQVKIALNYFDELQ